MKNVSLALIGLFSCIGALAAENDPAQPCRVCHTGPLSLDVTDAAFEQKTAAVVRGELAHPPVAVEATEAAIEALLVALKKDSTTQGDG